MMRHRTRRAFVLAVLTTATVVVALGSGIPQALAKGAVNTIGSPGVAIKGFDPVAYFKDGRPRRGSKAHAFHHKGVEWHFSSAENMVAFATNPSKYEPAYGGYCAYGVASGYLAKIEGDAWAIRGGRLYLNYDDGVQKKWAQSTGAFIGDADRQWQKIKPAH